MLATALFLVSMATASPPKLRKIVHKVTVDGSLFKVRVRGSTVTVKRQTMAFNANIKHRDMMRQAAVRATGCELVDEMVNIAAELEASLDCMKK